MIMGNFTNFGDLEHYIGAVQKEIIAATISVDFKSNTIADASNLCFILQTSDFPYGGTDRYEKPGQNFLKEVATLLGPDGTSKKQLILDILNNTLTKMRADDTGDSEKFSKEVFNSDKHGTNPGTKIMVAQALAHQANHKEYKTADDVIRYAGKSERKEKLKALKQILEEDNSDIHFKIDERAGRIYVWGDFSLIFKKLNAAGLAVKDSDAYHLYTELEDFMNNNEVPIDFYHEIQSLMASLSSVSDNLKSYLGKKGLKERRLTN